MPFLIIANEKHMVKRSTDEPTDKALLRLQQFEAARTPQEKKEEKPIKKAEKKKAAPKKSTAKKSSKKK